MERLVLFIDEDIELQRLVAAVQQGTGREYLKSRPVLVEYLAAADEIVGDDEDVQLLRSLLAEE